MMANPSMLDRPYTYQYLHLYEAIFSKIVDSPMLMPAMHIWHIREVRTTASSSPQGPLITYRARYRKVTQNI